MVAARTVTTHPILLAFGTVTALTCTGQAGTPAALAEDPATAGGYRDTPRCAAVHRTGELSHRALNISFGTTLNSKFDLCI